MESISQAKGFDTHTTHTYILFGMVVIKLAFYTMREGVWDGGSTNQFPALAWSGSYLLGRAHAIWRTICDDCKKKGTIAIHKLNFN